MMPWIYNDNYPPAHAVKFASWWTLYRARLFGRKKVGRDDGMKVTMYQWRGITYVWSVKLDTLDD
jgi:hypothetical protein